MNFKGEKKFDYNDITNFLPDNFTVGTSDFYEMKFNDKLPDHYCDILELLARVKYDETETTEKINIIKLDIKESNQRLINELTERSLEYEELIVENIDIKEE